MCLLLDSDPLDVQGVTRHSEDFQRRKNIVAAFYLGSRDR
ncbi:hypothetical protein CBM2633_U10046 [Cupriavidus taiwanensis]|nr:hypothetical protein CBM2633_U10046 [Cupriavidus taiwanensis]